MAHYYMVSRILYYNTGKIITLLNYLLLRHLHVYKELQLVYNNALVSAEQKQTIFVNLIGRGFQKFSCLFPPSVCFDLVCFDFPVGLHLRE